MSDVPAPLAGMTLEEAEKRRGDLLRSIASGALSVRNSDGSSVTYRSGPEMTAALRLLDNAILAASASPNALPRPSRFYFQTSKGL